MRHLTRQKLNFAKILQQGQSQRKFGNWAEKSEVLDMDVLRHSKEQLRKMNHKTLDQILKDLEDLHRHLADRHGFHYTFITIFVYLIT